MYYLRLLFNFYIQSSIHVAFSVTSLIQITQYWFQISYDKPIQVFAFFGTIFGYNFVKYQALVRTQKLRTRMQLKVILVLSVLSFLIAGFYFFLLKNNTKIIGFACFMIILLYTLPFFPNQKNARNWAGIKIYIVALSWVSVSVVLPIINAKIPITSDFYFKCVQQFILIFVLILIFEIIDLKNDDPHLKTVPQQIGVKWTKFIAYFLTVMFLFLDNPRCYFMDEFTIVTINHKMATVMIFLILLFFIRNSNENKSKYYTSFWVESVPIIWWFLFFILF